MVLRRDIGIQQQLLGSFQRKIFSGKQRMFSSLFIAHDVPVFIKEIGQRRIVFPVARFHFCKEFFLQSFGILHHRVHIAVFCLQIGGYRRIVALIHPEIGISAYVAMGLQFFWNLLRHGRLVYWCTIFNHYVIKVCYKNKNRLS